MIATLRRAALLLALLPLAGCAAIASLDASSRTLDTFQLSAPAGAGGSGRGPVLSVEPPAASGAVASERIAIRAAPLSVQYLPDGQWIEPAPAHVRGLLVQALTATGRFSLVSGAMGGPLPDLALYSDLQAFEAVVAPDETGAPVQVVVRLKLALVRDRDRSLVAARTFERRAGATGDSAAEIVRAFDAAMQALLPEAAGWTVRAAGAGV